MYITKSASTKSRHLKNKTNLQPRYDTIHICSWETDILHVLLHRHVVVISQNRFFFAIIVSLNIPKKPIVFMDVQNKRTLCKMTYLYSDRYTNDHSLFQEFLIKCRRMVVHVEDGDKDFGQAVLSL